MSDNSWPEATAISVTAISTAVVLSPWPWVSEAPWAAVTAIFSALAALGTVAAVIVALRVSRRDIDWRKSQEAREASVVWAIVRADLARTSAALHAVRKCLDYFSPDCPKSIRKEPLIEETDASLTGLTLNACWKLSEKLAWLPAEKAEAIAKVMGTMSLFSEDVHHFVRTFDKRPADNVLRAAESYTIRCDLLIQLCYEALHAPSRG